MDSKTGEFVINIRHEAVLTVDIKKDKLKVQQMTCLPIFTTAPKQYLCFLTTFNTVTANNAESTMTW